jgi:hypothetical protein
MYWFYEKNSLFLGKNYREYAPVCQTKYYLMMQGLKIISREGCLHVAAHCSVSMRADSMILA